VIATEAQHVLQVYRRSQVVFERGSGCYLYAQDGRRYLDLISGVGVAALGHANPKLRAALEAQAALLWHASNLFTTEPQIRLAERLTACSFAEAIFFCNSGAEANEAALKLARKWHRDQGQDRYEIIAFENAFHGRTLFTVSATGTPAYWKGFEPLVPGTGWLIARLVTQVFSRALDGLGRRGFGA